MSKRKYKSLDESSGSVTLPTNTIGNKFLDQANEYQHFLSVRNIEVICKSCKGLGVKSYGNTTQWRSGYGGQTITSGICDKCWGSGDSDSPWISHKKIEKLIKIKNAAQSYIESQSQQPQTFHHKLLQKAIDNYNEN